MLYLWIYDNSLIHLLSEPILISLAKVQDKPSPGS